MSSRFDSPDGTGPSNANPDVEGPDDGPATRLCHAAIERNDDAPDVCTIYSAINRRSVQRAWISAEAGSFFAREDAR